MDARLILVAVSILCVVCGSIFLEILHRRSRRAAHASIVKKVEVEEREESLI